MTHRHQARSPSMSSASRVRRNVGAVDGWILDAVRAEPGSRCLGLWRSASALGSRHAVYPVVAWQLVRARGSGRAPWRYATALLGADLSQELLKFLVRRQRPPHQGRLAPAHGNSLPSRHTTLVTVAATVLADGSERPALRWSVRALVAATAASRLRLAVHWPSDVLCGWLLGAGWAAACQIGRHPDAPSRGSVLTRRRPSA
ncbi:phosphatase PAP2 family protein [Streptacidiphilus sp. 4-A2]|nr:phosphatase PAP2 family protein [Streptacidiphilus sp. 4-A2]